MLCVFLKELRQFRRSTATVVMLILSAVFAVAAKLARIRAEQSRVSKTGNKTFILRIVYLLSSMRLPLGGGGFCGNIVDHGCVKLNDAQ